MTTLILVAIGCAVVYICGITSKKKLPVAQALPQELYSMDLETWRYATVKWFDPARGYGFVSIGDEYPDVLLHIAVLRTNGISCVREKQAVQVQVLDRPRGLQVFRIKPC